MHRRAFLGAVAGGLLAVPLAPEAQQSGGMPRIGILTPAAAATGTPYDQFREALRGLGYIEGTNITFEFRLTGGKVELLPELAADLVRLKVDVIVTDGGEPSVRAAMNATQTIPIVMGTGPDPVASGLVASLARPGGISPGSLFPILRSPGSGFSSSRKRSRG